MTIESEISRIATAVERIADAIEKIAYAAPPADEDEGDGSSENPGGDWSQLFEVKDDKAIMFMEKSRKPNGALILQMYPSDKEADVPNRIKYSYGQRFLGNPAPVKIDGGQVAFMVKPGANGTKVLPYSPPLYALGIDVKKV